LFIVAMLFIDLFIVAMLFIDMNALAGNHVRNKLSVGEQYQ